MPEQNRQVSFLSTSVHKTIRFQPAPKALTCCVIRRTCLLKHGVGGPSFLRHSAINNGSLYLNEGLDVCPAEESGGTIQHGIYQLCIWFPANIPLMLIAQLLLTQSNDEVYEVLLS